jgi:probable phosphoglycerate mutase
LPDLISGTAHRTLGIAAGLLLILVACLAATASATPSGPSAQIFLVRHAEKVPEAEDPELSQAGEQRAQALAGLLRDAGIGAVFSTDYRRTRDTAAPLASALGLYITIYDPARLSDLAAELNQRCGRCLVIGHSNTTPELVGLLGGEPGAPIDEASEYDRLYVVSIGPDGAVSTVLLRYGD